jgi:hypothetical protein
MGEQRARKKPSFWLRPGRVRPDLRIVADGCGEKQRSMPFMTQDWGVAASPATTFRDGEWMDLENLSIEALVAQNIRQTRKLGASLCV